MEKRKYRRAASDVQIGFQVAEADPVSRDYYEGLVENYGFGGLFIATPVQLSPGDVLYLSITVGDQPPVEARALVRWTRRWSKPRGVGVEFIEFDHIGERDFETFLAELFEPDAGRSTQIDAES